MLVIRVPRLRSFVPFDRNRGYRRHQTTLIQDTLYERKNSVMHGNPIVGRAECEKVVNPNRTQPLEQVLRWPNGSLLLDAPQILFNRVDKVGLDHTLEDGVPVTLDTLHMLFYVERLQGHTRQCRTERKRGARRFSRRGGEEELAAARSLGGMWYFPSICAHLPSKQTCINKWVELDLMIGTSIVERHLLRPTTTPARSHLPNPMIVTLR